MAGLLDIDPTALYGDALTPDQRSALAWRGLLGFAGGMAPYLGASRLPVSLGQSLAAGAGGMGAAQDEAARTGLQAQLYGLQGKQLQFNLDMRNRLLPMVENLMHPGAEGGSAAPPAAPGAPPVTAAGTTQVGSTGNWEIDHNNFGGIRIPGSTVGPKAGGFQAYPTPLDGIAAISTQLDRYASGATTGKPVNTLRGIVSTWAPSSQNPTDALIARATRVTGFDPDQPLDVSNPAVKAKLIEATIRNEMGGKLPVDPAMIAQVASTPRPPVMNVGGAQGLMNPYLRGTAPVVPPAPGMPPAPMPPAAPSGGLLAQGSPAAATSPSTGILAPGAPAAAPPAMPGGMVPGGGAVPHALDPRAALGMGILGDISGMPSLGQAAQNYGFPAPGWYRGTDGQWHPELPNDPNWKAYSAAKEAAAVQPFKLEQEQAGPRERGEQNRQTAQFETNLKTNPNALNFSPQNLPAGPGTTEPMPVLPSPQHPMPSTLPPLADAGPILGSATQLEDKEKEWGKEENLWNGQLQENAVAIQRISAMSDAMKLVQTGAYTSDLAHFHALLKTAGVNIGDSVLPDPAQVQIILKNNFQAAIATMKSTGNSRWTQRELAGAQESMSNPDLQPEANLAIMAQAIGTLQWENTKIQDWVQAKRNGWRDPLDYERAWVARNPLQPIIDQTAKSIGPLAGMGKPMDEQTKADAADAIRRGAPRDAVIKRARELGFDPSGL
jgi:hypothetical protein